MFYIDKNEPCKWWIMKLPAFGQFFGIHFQVLVFYHLFNDAVRIVVGLYYYLALFIPSSCPSGYLRQ
ncbi:hypothetical protein D3C87_1472490 [compost metagenome]